jgi:cytochrome b
MPVSNKTNARPLLCSITQRGGIARETAVSNPFIVWDLPTRLFHWILVVLIVLQYFSGEFGIVPMEWHYVMGYATLALIVFRVLWGLAGSRTSRFADFLRGPRAVMRYASDLLHGRAERQPIGHNPIGGWSAVLMLACIAVQTVSGLFSSDDLTETGPLAGRVSDATVELMTRIHHFNRYVLLVLIVLHVGAVVLHWAIRHDNLIGSMLHGRRSGEGESVRIAPLWRALAFALASAAAVWGLVWWGGRA